MKILVTGGAGFIGSHFVRTALSRWPEARLTVIDKLTYSGNRQNLAAVSTDERFHFIKGDICVPADVDRAMEGCSHVVNFAAETHVDRSILDSGAFARTDIEGTRVLLEAARKFGVERYLQVSTDEVYGDVEAPRRAAETDTLWPRSPYSASKAGADLLVGAYHATYGSPILITRGSNTYGPNQHPEKLVPLFVTNALQGLPLPIYGDGRQMREWLHVEDHCAGISEVLDLGSIGEIYNLGPERERPNLEIIERIVELTGCDRSLLQHVPDRPGHDRRYALDATKARKLGWTPCRPLDTGLAETVRWYTDNQNWWKAARDGAFDEYYRLQYADRLSQASS